jgi:hypothetical protein
MTEVIGYESMVLDVPIDCPNVNPELDCFILSLQTSGQLTVIFNRSGLRGVASK